MGALYRQTEHHENNILNRNRNIHLTKNDNSKKAELKSNIRGGHGGHGGRPRHFPRPFPYPYPYGYPSFPYYNPVIVYDDIPSALPVTIIQQEQPVSQPVVTEIKKEEKISEPIPVIVEKEQPVVKVETRNKPDINIKKTSDTQKNNNILLLITVSAICVAGYLYLKK